MDNANFKYTLPKLLHELDLLRSQADSSFQKVALAYPQAIACANGCDDCCHALFDLSQLEALSLAIAFQQLSRRERHLVYRRAIKAAMLFDKITATALFKQHEERLRILSQARIPCPLLKEKHCLLYQNRPLTCRLYGIPLAIQNVSHTCYRSHFKTGLKYPTVDMNILHFKLEFLSRKIIFLIPNLELIRRDVARALELSYTHGSTLRHLLS